ncbi:alpha/beta hydrolase [Acidobacteriota bacterium]
MKTVNVSNVSITDDSDWKNYVYKSYRRLLKLDKVEAQVFMATRFESMTPFSACFEKIKDIPPGYYGIRQYECIKIPTRDGLALDAWFFPAARARGTLIILHGGGFNMADSLEQSVYLLKHRYQLLIYNARYWTFSRNPDCYVGFVGNDLADLGYALCYLKSRDDVDAGKIGILGYSYGGLKCLLFAPESRDIKVVISDGAPLRLLWLDEQMKKDREFREKVKERLQERYGFDLYSEKYDVTEQIKKISPKPLLLLQGVHDPIIPVEITKKLFALAQPPREMHIFKNTGHCDGMLTRDKEEYIRIVTGFLFNYLH